MQLRTTTSIIAGCLMAATASASPSDRWNLPIATMKLDNGLTVVVSEDHSSPTVGVSLVYRVGIRTEPRDRTGFAHLFEHLMFEGTPNAPQGVFDRVIADGGGDNNGSTHPDFTSYIERAPVSALEPLLWLEADRMKTLAFTQQSLNAQRAVVKEEIRVNVKNQPYGGFAEADLPLLAFSKWENGHDGYGSFDDLDKASLDDVRGFHRDFYGPNNAVLGIAGDVTPEQGFALAKKYFGAIPARPVPPRPDVAEPLNTSEKRIVQGDALARLPAVAVGWKMPARGSSDQAAMIVLGELLAVGDASRLYQSLVKGSALAVQVNASVGSGSPWEYDGPTLYTLLIVYKDNGKADPLLAVVDAQIARIAKEGVDQATLQGLKARMLADWYDGLEPFVDRADILAILQSVWGDATVANRIPDLIDGVSSADLQRVAATYLTHANRSIIDRRPDDMLPPGDPARSSQREKAKRASEKAASAKSALAKPAAIKPAPAKPAPTQISAGAPSAEKIATAPPNDANGAASAPAKKSPPPAPSQTSVSIPIAPAPSTPRPASSASANSGPTNPAPTNPASTNTVPTRAESKTSTTNKPDSSKATPSRPIPDKSSTDKQKTSGSTNAASTNAASTNAIPPSPPSGKPATATAPATAPASMQTKPEAIKPAPPATPDSSPASLSTPIDGKD